MFPCMTLWSDSVKEKLVLFSALDVLFSSLGLIQPEAHLQEKPVEVVRELFCQELNQPTTEKIQALSFYRMGYNKFHVLI